MSFASDPTAEGDKPSSESVKPSEDEQQRAEGQPDQTANVIPTSPQYGVAIIPNESEPTVVGPEDKCDDSKTATPRREERFKVVKIASLEPFKRGRWKCMDYLDEAPPPTSKVATGVGIGTPVYMQTQSLPQQHIQQMLMQGGYANAQFYPGQVMPHTQYFYQQGNMPVQNMPVQSGGMPPQFITTTQPYFPAGMVPNTAVFTVPQNFQNVQYVSQNSAFVPTSQNFQQSQTYAGPPSQAQPMVNGHAFSQNDSPASTLPAKSVILNQPVQNQQYVTQNQYQPQGFVQTTAQTNPTVTTSVPTTTTTTQIDSLPIPEGTETNEASSDPPATTESTENPEPDDPAKTNPVVNAIDNKIEQAMDLVKSHLMYTVREEVEVLKEKIAELMERIQQLETENNYLRSQIPKNNNNNTGGNPDPPAQPQ